MANQSVSPNEAEIARDKLKAMPPDTKSDAVVFFDGQPIGNVIHFEFHFDDDPGTGIYDFKNEKWTWYKATPSGTT